ncbi:MAG TPA: HEAT repeat domain-containing protein [Lacipirellulaceae bacterium]
MIELDAEKAVVPLVSIFLTEQSKLVRRGIGLALRRGKHSSTLAEVVSRWLADGDLTQRCAAAEIAGWVGPPYMYDQLCSILRADRLYRVRHVAGHALQRFQLQETMADIIESIPRLHGAALWCSVDSLLQLDDVKFVGTKGDSLWIDPVYDHLGSALQRHLNKKYRERISEIERDLKWPDND